MKVKRRPMVAGMLALIALVGALAAGTVFAQSTTPPTQTAPAAPWGHDWGRGLGFWGGGGSMANFDGAARAPNLTPTQLFEQLHSGKTLAEVAQAQGVDLQKVQDALAATRTQAMKDAINQAVKDGKITQAQADWLIQGLDNGYMGKGSGRFGFGGHMGFGAMRGFQGKGRMPAPNTPTPGTTS